MSKFFRIFALISFVALTVSCGNTNTTQNTNAQDPAGVILDSSKDITAFEIGTSIGIIGTDSIEVTVPFGTSVTALTPTVVISGVSVTPASGDTLDFTSPVTYTVTAADSSTKTYTVTVTVAPSTAKDINSFVFAEAPTSLVTIGTNTIDVIVPFGTVLTALTPTVGITGLSVLPASDATINFTSPVTYTVTAADASTKDYTVTVRTGVDITDSVTTANVVEIQHIGFGIGTPSSGTWTLTYNGVTTNTLAYNIDAATLEAELRLIPELATVTVTGNMNASTGFDITFNGVAGDALDLTASDTLKWTFLWWNIDVTTTITTPTTGNVEVQALTFAATPTAGTWELTYNGTATAPLAYDIDAITLETALRAIPELTAVTVTGDIATGFVVTFNGVAGAALPLVVSNNILSY